MNPDVAALIACESVLEPILEQLIAVLEEDFANFAGPVGEALERLRAAAADASLMISAVDPRDGRTDTTRAPLGPRWTHPPPLTELITAGSASAAANGETSEAPGRSAIRHTAPVGAKRTYCGLSVTAVTTETLRGVWRRRLRRETRPTLLGRRTAGAVRRAARRSPVGRSAS